MDRQTALRIQELVRTLEADEANLDPRQASILHNARARLAEAEQTTGEFTSRYRGALQGVTLRGADELAGLAAGAVPGGMTQEQALEPRHPAAAAAAAAPTSPPGGGFCCPVASSEPPRIRARCR